MFLARKNCVKSSLVLGIYTILLALNAGSSRAQTTITVPTDYPTIQARKITALVLGWVEDSVLRSDSRGFGVAEASSRSCIAARSHAWDTIKPSGPLPIDSLA